MIVDFAVQAHPARALTARTLAEKVAGRIAWDPDPEGVPSTWRTYRHLLQTVPTGATHLVQLQDDAIVCPYFAETALACARARPDRLLVFFVSENLYHHAQAIRDACARDEPWAELGAAYWCPAVATCWPVRLIAGILEFVEEQIGPSRGSTRDWWETGGADDEIVGRYLRQINERPLATVPSLVDHPPGGISLASNGRERLDRVAACWIGDCADCTDPRTIVWD